MFVPGLNRVVGGSARWLVLGPLPGVHPAEIAKLALIVYLAHWLASRGKKIGGFRSGTVPFLLIAVPVIALVFKEPDLGTTVVITLTAFTMFFVAGASLWQLGAMGGIGFAGVLLVGLKDYQLERIRTFIDPWADPLGTGFHTIQGLLALGLGGIFGTGLGESKLAGGLYLPERLERLHLRDHRRGVRVRRRRPRDRACSCSSPTPGSGRRSGRRTRSARCSRSGSPAGCASRRSSTSRSSSRCCR